MLGEQLCHYREGRETRQQNAPKQKSITRSGALGSWNNWSIKLNENYPCIINFAYETPDYA